MNPKERFLTALSGKTPDRIPLFDFPFSKNLFKEILGYAPNEYNAEDVVDLSIKIGWDGVKVPINVPGRVFSQASTDENVSINSWGTKRKHTGSSWPIGAPIDHPIKSIEEFKNYEPPQITSKDINSIKSQVKDLKKRVGNQLAVLGGISGPFTASWMLTGLEYYSMLIFEDKEIISSLVTMATNYYLDYGKAMIEAGIDAILIADDWGYNEALFLSPEHFRQFILPSYRYLVQSFRNADTLVLMHNDGNLNKILKEINNTGINGYHPVERKAHMSIKNVKSEYGSQLCLVGNINSSDTLPYGSIEDVENEVKDCIRIAGPGGGYICGSDHSIHDKVPIENVVKIVETINKYGYYPINNKVLK